MLEPIVIGLIVMLLRATDVSLSTLKTVYIVEGRSGLAPAISFFEAGIYVVAATLVFRDLGNPFTMFGFAAGYALGTSVGMLLARRLGLGNTTVRITQPGDGWDLADALRKASFRLTTFSGVGRDGPVSVIELNVRKRQVANVLAVVRPWLNASFVTVGDEPVQAGNQTAIFEMLRRAPGFSWALQRRGGCGEKAGGGIVVVEKPVEVVMAEAEAVAPEWLASGAGASAAEPANN